MQTRRGFTLVEVVTVLAVVAVLASVAAPSLGALVRSTRASMAANVFLSDLLLTRSEAIKRRSHLVMCRSADGISCATRGGWEQGWIIFADRNGNGVRDASEALVGAQQALGTGLRIKATATLAQYVSYVANGTTHLVGGGFQAGTLTVCAQSELAVWGQQIVINADGRPRTQKVRLASCT